VDALNPNQPASSQGILTPLRWGSTAKGVDAGDAAAAWFTDYLKKTVRLVRFSGHRPLDSKYASQGETAFSDGYPMLLTTSESLRDLNRRLPQPVPMSRFRPNIVVTGASKPWEEDMWRRVRVGPPHTGAWLLPPPLRPLSSPLLALLRAVLRRRSPSEATVLRSVKPCSRCTVRARAAAATTV
jgi:uncharacterized protein YcbX